MSAGEGWGRSSKLLSADSADEGATLHAREAEERAAAAAAATRHACASAGAGTAVGAATPAPAAAPSLFLRQKATEEAAARGGACAGADRGETTPERGGEARPDGLLSPDSVRLAAFAAARASAAAAALPAARA